MGYKITERAVRYRIRKLETSNTVLGYSTILNPSFVSQRVNRTVILKFKYSYNASTLIDRLENYVQEASSVSILLVMWRVYHDAVLFRPSCGFI